MQQRGDDDPESLRVLSNVLDYAGYESVLLVYHSLLPDYLIRAANIINKEHKLKYMFAMRTYAVSPEYCAMMCEAFNTIDSNRIMLNIAAGDLKEEETSSQDVVRLEDLLKTYEGRVEYTSDWLDKFSKIKVLKNKPEIIVSGTSQKTIENSEKHADCHLAMKYSYINGLKVKTKRKMASCKIVIRDTNEEAKAFYDKEENKMMKESIIYGTEQEVIDKMRRLEKLGITDFLISLQPDDDQVYRLHNMTYNITHGENSGY